MILNFCKTLILYGQVFFADGVYIPPPESEIYSTNQIAVIKYQKGIEHLVILVKVHTEADDFGWIVPLPSEPVVKEADVEMFRDLSIITASIVRGYESEGCNCGTIAETKTVSDEIDIIEVSKIGILDYSVIRAENPSPVVQYLQSKGLQMSDQIENLLMEYMQRGWFYLFCAYLETERTEPLGYEYRYGEIIQPVELTFNTDTPVYPLKVSSLNVWWDFELIIYVVAENRMKFDEAELKFSSRFTSEDEKWLSSGFASFYEFAKPPFFLTKLKRFYEDPQQLDDIELYRAENDLEYREVVVQ
jgi:hypothetical protein